MQHIHTRQRPKRDLVQLDHAIVFKDWRNIIHNVHTLTGASNYNMVKVELLVKPNESKRSTRLSTQPTDSAFGKIISEMMLTENHDTDNSQPPHSLPSTTPAASQHLGSTQHSSHHGASGKHSDRSVHPKTPMDLTTSPDT